MTRKERSLKAVEALEKLYPDAVCSLTYAHSYELLIATRLSVYRRPGEHRNKGAFF